MIRRLEHRQLVGGRKPIRPHHTAVLCCGDERLVFCSCGWTVTTCDGADAADEEAGYHISAEVQWLPIGPLVERTRLPITSLLRKIGRCNGPRVARIERSGMIHFAIADAICAAIKVHPAQVWDQW